MTFTTEDMNRRTKEALAHGELVGADIAMECVDKILIRLKSRDRFRVMSALRDAVSASLTKNIKKLGGG